ncbi:RimJ/RimL family protein N-acetyltransferase [Novosphingobium sp. PhB165]|uniref:GNAT family N-acetyltransferase n=1 Tax=Novosphingobium sp. PhB165 TaxID=2485105 RepID=UPI0010DF971F|nr:GNAT family N-acetyltransferase [Novosphingobium sp. PhB165]TCM18518.1 RimJ/RimL family protein N-acetyltransferase [Novosphingobium sp. PhB165]
MTDFLLETDRLVLRGWTDEDATPFLAMCSDPAVMEFLGPLASAAQVAEIIARQQGFQRDYGHCFWAIERKSDGQFLGFCGLKPGPVGTPLEGRVEIGWRLAREAWGQGYARESAAASLDWGFTVFGADAILAMTVLGNSRSWGLMERLGMTRRHDQDFDHPALAPEDPLRPHIVYSITQAEWAAQAR